MFKLCIACLVTADNDLFMDQFVSKLLKNKKYKTCSYQCLSRNNKK